MKPKISARTAVVVCAAIGAVIFVFSRSACIEAVYPFQRAKVSFTRNILTRITGLWNGSKAMAENVQLKRTIDAQIVDKNEYERLYQENCRLRRTLNYAEAKKAEFVPAEVLSFGGGTINISRTLRVGKGSLAGIREGAVVESPDGLVGKVISVTPHTSDVLLITDPSLKVSCKVELLSDKPLLGVLHGGNNDLLLLEYLKSGSKIPPRAKVYTSGLGGVFPAGIEIGTLCTDDETEHVNIRSDANLLGCNADVVPSVDFSALEDVFIRK